MAREVIARPAPRQASDRQVVEILVAGGYHPDTIEAAAGVPLRVIFRRQDDHPCSDRVIFARPRLERYLAPRSVTIVDLPALASGEIRFTCGMGRYRGRIQLVPAATKSAVTRRVARFATALTVGAAGLSVGAAAVSTLGGSASTAFALGLLTAGLLALAAVVSRAAWRTPRHP